MEHIHRKYNWYAELLPEQLRGCWNHLYIDSEHNSRLPAKLLFQLIIQNLVAD